MIAIEKPFTYGLTDLINNLCAPKKSIMQLIHIKTREQYNVASRALESKGYKPFEIGREYRGECYIENTNQFLVYPPVDYNVTNAYEKGNEIISFEDFINEHK